MQVIHGNVFIPAGKTAPSTSNKQGQAAANTAGSFNDILTKKIGENEELQFSKHAEMRLKSRDITLSNEQMQRAFDGVMKARTKGIKDSLVLVDDVALVVNTKSNVVITALESKLDSVFTNIDGAIIV